MGHFPTPVLDDLSVLLNMIFTFPWGYPTEMEVCWKYVVLVCISCIQLYS